MIATASIQAVKDRMDIIDVVGQFVKLVKRGNSYNACCPFHDEKTPSFSANPTRQRWHCFGGCGGGDAISFVQKHENKTYPEAIEWLASHYSIILEYKEETAETKAAREKVRDQKELMSNVVAFALRIYGQHIIGSPNSSAIWQYLHKRQITKDVAIQWEFGYAPDDFKHITTPLINQNLYQPAFDCALINTKEGNSYDVYRNRLIIPIHDHSGNLVGLAGRWIDTGDKETDKKQPKYINPKESELYNKSKVWFGLYQALTAKAFKAENGIRPPAIITEGYLDVISLHEAGVLNAVAGCGTSITVDQVRLLKRYTDHFIILTDGDEAGKKAAMRLVDICLQENVRTDVIELPGGMDPDEYVKHYLLINEGPADGAFAE